MYINLLFRDLNIELKRGIDDAFVYRLELRSVMFTCFILVLFVIYIFLWRPFVTRLSREVSLINVGLSYKKHVEHDSYEYNNEDEECQIVLK